MKISYDPQHNIAYICFRDASEEVETIHVSDEIKVDVAADGKVYGIELLNANEQLQIVKDGAFTFTDESTGKTVKLPVGVK